MLKKISDDYIDWYNRGKAVADLINSTVVRVVNGFEADTKREFISEAFYDGLRDNLTLDPEE